MIVQYFQESDMLYIQLKDAVSTESEEVVPNFVLDYDEAGCAIGIEIEDASRSIDLSTLEISALPLVNLVMKQSQGSASATHA